MTHPLTKNVWVRGVAGIKVELAPAELLLLLAEQQPRPKKRKARCTFLPGVSASYDAWAAGTGRKKGKFSKRDPE